MELWDVVYRVFKIKLFFQIIKTSTKTNYFHYAASTSELSRHKSFDDVVRKLVILSPRSIVFAFPVSSLITTGSSSGESNNTKL